MSTDDRSSHTATAPAPWWQPWPEPQGPPAPHAVGGASHDDRPPTLQNEPTPAPTRASRWKSRVGAGVAAIALCLGSGVAGAELALRDQPAATSAVATSDATRNEPPISRGGSNPSQHLAKVAAAMQPSIVSLRVSAPGGSGSGSGVILRSDGTILTNNHVVEAAAQGGSIEVAFADGKKAEADLVGRDPATDLAVVKARGMSGLKPVTLGSADDVHVGDTVLAVGSPLGLEGSVSAGIVSALHRPVNVGTTTLSDAIQTDAPINPGNSGGGLFDSSGRLIGINSAIATLGGGGQSGNIGLGFAIPVDSAKSIADQLIRGEKPTHALLGVQIADSEADGALLAAVTPDGPAADAGLRPGDVITKLGDRVVEDATDLSAAVRSQQPGDKVEVTYQRDGETGTTSATLGSAS